MIHAQAITKNIYQRPPSTSSFSSPTFIIFYVNKNIMNSKYSIIKQIGQGQYGQIFLATLKDSPDSNQQFAIKKINNQNIDAEHILLPQINHPNILRVH